MKKEAILFDLDGTLLPMQQDKFVDAYFNELSAKLCPIGCDKQHFIDSIWKGTYAMVKNDGKVTNEERFWNTFGALMGNFGIELEEEFTGFYRNEFNRAKSATGENALADKAISLARQKADQVILATNPIFPLCAVETRLSWIGLRTSDFDYITTYENSSYSKPNPDYYSEIMRKIKADPINCLMIGNDIDEDFVPSGKIGIECFLVTDCLISGKNDIKAARNGTFSQMLEYMNSL